MYMDAKQITYSSSFPMDAKAGFNIKVSNQFPLLWIAIYTNVNGLMQEIKYT